MGHLRARCHRLQRPYPFGGNDYVWHVKSLCHDCGVVCGNINCSQTNMGLRKNEERNVAMLHDYNVLHTNGECKEKAVPALTLESLEEDSSKKGHGTAGVNSGCKEMGQPVHEAHSMKALCDEGGFSSVNET